jgi:hypothetical protein
MVFVGGALRPDDRRADHSSLVCHSERSEESMCDAHLRTSGWILHSVQDDRPCTRSVSASIRAIRGQTACSIATQWILRCAQDDSIGCAAAAVASGSFLKPITACSALRAQDAAIIFVYFVCFVGPTACSEFRVFRVFRGQKVWSLRSGRKTMHALRIRVDPRHPRLTGLLRSS